MSVVTRIENMNYIAISVVVTTKEGGSYAESQW